MKNLKGVLALFLIFLFSFIIFSPVHSVEISSKSSGVDTFKGDTKHPECLNNFDNLGYKWGVARGWNGYCFTDRNLTFFFNLTPYKYYQLTNFKFVISHNGWSQSPTTGDIFINANFNITDNYENQTKGVWGGSYSATNSSAGVSPALGSALTSNNTYWFFNQSFNITKDILSITLTTNSSLTQFLCSGVNSCGTGNNNTKVFGTISFSDSALTNYSSILNPPVSTTTTTTAPATTTTIKTKAQTCMEEYPDNSTSAPAKNGARFSQFLCTFGDNIFSFALGIFIFLVFFGILFTLVSVVRNNL